MFYSWAVLQVTTALCCSSVHHGKPGTEAKQPSPFLSQLPFEPLTVCICRFDLVVGMRILSNTGLCPKHTTESDQRDSEKTSCVSLADKTQSQNTVWTGTSKSFTHRGGGEDWSHTNLEKSKALSHYSDTKSVLPRPATVMLSSISYVSVCTCRPVGILAQLDSALQSISQG